MKIFFCLLLLMPVTLHAQTIPELLAKGESNLALGNLATADKAFRDALGAALKTKDRKSEAAARNGVARVFAGNRWEVLGNLQLALAIHRELKDAKGEASDLARMGEIKFLHGFRLDAIASLTEAAAIQERLGLAEERAATLEHLGVVLQSTGAYEEAATHLATAVELRRRGSVPTFELVRAEVRLATLQTLLGLDEYAVQHLQAAKETIRRFCARIPEKKWNAMRAAWVKHGQNFNKGMGPMAMNLAEMMTGGGVQMATEDVELLDLIAPQLELLGQGREMPDDAPKFPEPPKVDFFAPDDPRGYSHTRLRWEAFLSTHSGELLLAYASESAKDAVAWLVEEVVAFNEEIGSPSDTTLEEQARDLNRLLREHKIKGSVTAKSLAGRASQVADERNSSEPAKLSRRMAAMSFMAMTNQVIGWMLRQMEDIRKDLVRQFDAADVVLAEKVWAAQPCEMEIQRRLQHILRLDGQQEQAKAENQLAWTLLDKQTAENTSLTGADTADRVAEQRRAARKLGLPIPPIFTNPCDGVLSAAKDTLWDADVAAAQGKTDEAIRLYTTAASGAPAMRATALTRIAFLRDTFDAYQQAIDAVEQVQGRLRLDELVTSWAGQQVPLYSRVIALSLERKQPDVAFAYAERARARAFLNQVGNRRLPPAVQPALAAELQEVRGKLIALETPQPEPPPLPLPMANVYANVGDPRKLEREQLQKRYSELLGRLAQSNPAYLSLVQVEPVNLAKLQREVLPAGTTLVEYFVLDDRVIAWVIDRENVRSVELKISAKDLNGRVGYFRNLITGRKPEWVATANELYATLIAPLKQHIRNASLIIVPHASLHYLPFAALRNDERHLVEEYAFTVAPSASALRFMRPSGKRSSSLLALGDPDRTLPHAETEARTVAKLYGTSAYVGKEATEKRLRSDAGRAGFVHVAAHATYDPLRPNFSRLELAPAGDDEKADGKLHVYEIPDLDFSLTRLAVLSACETALGPRSSGDDLVALTRAFLAAGAPAVMTTLWSIDDPASSTLMESFYRRMHKGVAPAAALRDAQLQVLRDSGLSHPYYWAAFTLTGRFD
ncbi:MAG TPA: CHAT domain-containing tetratricopeptide repeat protein [Thermoanaerobaculia bacterium]|nr:CHAT domain-containing tetratricopeptide repeat protein [Thermoanaerobaculia bacterium]